MPRLWAYLLRYRYRYAGGIACLLGSRGLAMIVPWLLGMTVDAIAGVGVGRSGTTIVSRYVALIAGIAVIQAVARTFSRFVIFNIGRDVEYDLRNDLFRHLEAQPLAFHRQRQTGDLMPRLVNDVTAVRLLLGLGILNFIDAPLAYALGLTAMLLKDVRLTVAALAVYPAAFLTVKRTSRLLMDRTFRVQEGLVELSSRQQENLSGMHVVQAYACGDHEVETFARANARFQELNLRLARVRGFIGPVMNIVGGAGVLVVLWYGGQEAIAGRLSVGDLVAFIGYLGQLAWPTMALGWMLSIVQRGRAAMQRLEQVFVIEPAIADRAAAWPEGETLRGEIAFEGVEFAYHTPLNGHRVLSGVNLTIPAGATLAIVGRTGSGKTTLVDLIPRLFDVSAGRVTIDGHDVREIPLGILRRAIGFVPQDPFLFSRSVRDNIRFGAPAATDD